VFLLGQRWCWQVVAWRKKKRKNLGVRILSLLLPYGATALRFELNSQKRSKTMQLLLLLLVVVVVEQELRQMEEEKEKIRRRRMWIQEVAPSIC